MLNSVKVVSGGGKEFTSIGHQSKDNLISAGTLKGNKNMYKLVTLDSVYKIQIHDTISGAYVRVWEGKREEK